MEYALLASRFLITWKRERGRGSRNKEPKRQFRRYDVCFILLSHAISPTRAACVMQKNRTQFRHSTLPIPTIPLGI